MKIAIVVISLLLPIVCGLTFVDDIGVTHEFEGQPKVILSAWAAVSLMHLGISQNQIAGVYGSWRVRGSDSDLENPESSSSFVADLSAEELSFLEGTKNLSPCFNDPSGICDKWDFEAIKEVEADHFIYLGDGFDVEQLKTVTDIMRKPPAFIDTWLENTPGCRGGPDEDYSVDLNECHARSMIDIVNRLGELGIALGVELAPTVYDDQIALCEAATSFSESAKNAHARGIRVLGGVFFFLNGVVTLFLGSPIGGFAMKRTLEELGLPLMHKGLCAQDSMCGSTPTQNNAFEVVNQFGYFNHCQLGQPLNECNDNVLYPVDFWLLEGRALLSAQNPDLIEEFPDRALQEGQVAHLWWGEGALSYRKLADMLNDISTKLNSAKRLYPRTPCTEADPTTVSFLKLSTGGLDGGEYACYNEAYHNKLYTDCPVSRAPTLQPTGSPTSIPTSSPTMISTNPRNPQIQTDSVVSEVTSSDVKVQSITFGTAFLAVLFSFILF